MRRENNFKPTTRWQKIKYIYKNFGLFYLLGNYYRYGSRLIIAPFFLVVRYLCIYLGLKKYKKLKLILTHNPTQKVSIIIPFRDTSDILKVCVESILDKTSYKNYEIILVNNQSLDSQTKDFIKKISLNPLVKIFDFNEPFNYSRLHNEIIKKIDTELVLLLNNDTEVISKNWLGHMVDIMENNPSVGCVGPLLLFHNNTIQHAGVSLGAKYGIPFHIYEGLIYNDINSLPQEANKIREVSAVTGACILTRKTLYQTIGGLDENNLKIAFNDIDYCLSVYDGKYNIVFTPNVSLYHYESYSRGLDYLDIKKSLRLGKESLHFIKKWSKYKIDPFIGFDTRVV